MTALSLAIGRPLAVSSVKAGAHPLPYPLRDRVAKVRIHYQPNEAEAAQLLKQLHDMVASYGPDYADYQVRLVTNPLDFMEKVAIFTAGYDDRIMEAVKQA